jgi:chitosanase
MFSWFRKAPPPKRAAIIEPVNATQKDTIYDLSAIYETGSVMSLKSYYTVTILGDGAGITYGMHQATARSGSLLKILDRYYQNGGFLQIRGEDIPLSQAVAIATRSIGQSLGAVSKEVRDLMDALGEAGSKPLMAASQRAVFDEMYWDPTYRAGLELGCRYALSYAVLYDLSIQSGAPKSADDRDSRLWKLRQKFDELPRSKGGGEREWVVALLKARRAWLANHTRPILRKTVYRVDSLLDLCDDGIAYPQVWRLALPLAVDVVYPSGRKTIIVRERKP